MGFRSITQHFIIYLLTVISIFTKNAWHKIAMRLYVYLMVTEAFVRNLNANSTPIGSTLSTSASVDSLTAGKDDVPVLRYLRTTVIADEDKKYEGQFATSHDERGFSFDALSNIDALKSTWKTFWMRILDDKPVELAFRSNGLMKAKGALVQHKNFKKWYESVKDNEKALNTLLQYYTKDQLYPVLDAWKIDPTKKVTKGILIGVSNKEVAKALQHELIERWWAARDTPLIVFKNMGLQMKLENILTNPNFIKWTEYLDRYNKESLDDTTNEINVLIENYNEKAVVEMLQAANAVGDTKDLTTKLQMQLIQRWLRSDVSPIDLLNKLKREGEQDLLNSPNLPLWIRYVKTYNTVNDIFDTSEIEVMLQRFDEARVAEMLIKAKEAKVQK